jgi:hypothetical protein
VVDGSGLENRHTRNGIGGSNPSLSATQSAAQRNLPGFLSKLQQMGAISRSFPSTGTREKRTTEVAVGELCGFFSRAPQGSPVFEPHLGECNAITNRWNSGRDLTLCARGVRHLLILYITARSPPPAIPATFSSNTQNGVSGSIPARGAPYRGGRCGTAKAATHRAAFRFELRSARKIM